MALDLVKDWKGTQVVHGEHFPHVLWLHSLLQVLLTIQGTCLDEAVSVVRAAKQGDVCRECAPISAKN